MEEEETRGERKVEEEGVRKRREGRDRLPVKWKGKREGKQR